MENMLLSPVADLSELDSSAIWTVRYLDPSGFECQLSLESATGSEVLKKAHAAIIRLKESQCVPVSRVSSSASDSQEVNEEDVLCPIHGIRMKRWSKGDRTWYSHRWEGGWCKGGKA